MNGKRMILILMLTLMLAVTTKLSAQEKTKKSDSAETTATTTTVATQTATPTEERMSSQEVRNQLHALLREYPPQLGTILGTDPTLLSDDAFLAHYPELARFVAAHPDVKHQSAYYVDEFIRRDQVPDHPVERMLEPFMAGGAMLMVIFAVAWVIRTLIDQRRWTRLAHTQSEVHNKILDRFGSASELLEYIKTPAGSRFLESAPIPLHSEAPRQGPNPRILGSIQLGVIICATAAGFLFISTRFTKDAADGLFAIGMIALCIGIGFIASAAVSIFLTRRLGASGDASSLAALNQ